MDANTSRQHILEALMETIVFTLDPDLCQQLDTMAEESSYHWFTPENPAPEAVRATGAKHLFDMLARTADAYGRTEMVIVRENQPEGAFFDAFFNLHKPGPSALARFLDGLAESIAKTAGRTKDVTLVCDGPGTVVVDGNASFYRR